MIHLKRWPKVKALQEKLNGKAKAEPGYRFYVLYDKVYRQDILEAAYAQVRANGGAAGVDGQTFAEIEAYGVARYLVELATEVKALRYKPQPVRRVLIPKSGKPGQFRPLGIPTIRDRIVQQAVKLLLEPIFEADFTDNAYGYRAGRSAHDALLVVNEALREGYVDVVDADLSKYFDTIPHAELMRSVQRRVVDRKVLWLIRAWLKVPVHEQNGRGRVVVSGGQHTKQGTPQGGVISPLLANIYFRRFLIAWTQHGLEGRLRARIVNYADDFVILTRGHARAAHWAARQILKGMRLTLNEQKTRLCHAWKDPFHFLGYTFGVQYTTTGGRRYLGFTPSKRSVKKYRETVRRFTASNQTLFGADLVAKALNQVTRGFWNYFRLGATAETRSNLDRYLHNRMWRWATRKYKRPTAKTDKPSLRRKAWELQIREACSMLVYGWDIRRTQPRPY